MYLATGAVCAYDSVVIFQSGFFANNTASYSGGEKTGRTRILLALTMMADNYNLLVFVFDEVV